MIIVGIDPGSRVTGYGVIALEGSRCRCLDYGSIEGWVSGEENSFPQRLERIYTGLCALLRKHPPSAIAVEGVFHAVNAQTALKLGQARGVALLAAAQSGATLFEYSPLEVKKAVVGYGRAQKSQIQLMVKTLLNMARQPEPHDAADALAIALCHAFNGSPARHSRRRWSRHP